MKRAARRLLGPRVLALKEAYNNQQLWRDLYPRLLPREPGHSIIEIGSAPGLRMLEFHARMGYEPFGVEYSDTGVEVNRRLFKGQGLPEQNVIHADFFSTDFQSEHRDRFDIVLSWSFMEHFDNPEDVVRKHAAILKPGGILIVMIPNLRGVYGPLVQYFRPEWRQIHNYEIMDRTRYAGLFATAGIEELFCNYHGLFSFQKLQAAPGSAKRHLVKALYKLQLPLNVLFNLAFRRGGPENRMFSQELLYIGRKPVTT
jgi:2-polyprenyl-3-methyl-5-hydroxy-6-metoxy-1,4-benzoquinol methylase